MNNTKIICILHKHDRTQYKTLNLYYVNIYIYILNKSKKIKLFKQLIIVKQD